MYCGLKISSTASIGPRKQKGAVLVIGMVLLLILMIGAVTMMNSSVQDEKMTGNSRRSIDAFHAAEAGMNHVLHILDEERWYNFSCTSPDAFLPDNGAEVDFGDNGATYRVVLTGDCTEDASGVIQDVRLRSIGTQADTASRTIEFMAGHSTPSWPALFMNDNGDCDFDSGTSNNFLFDGNGGAAIGSNSANCLSNIEDEIDNVDRRDRYDGALIHYNPAPDFTSAKGLQDFYNAAITAYAQGAAGVNVVNADGYKTAGKDDTLDKTDLQNLLTADGNRSLGTTASVASNDPSYDPSVNVPVMKTTVVQGNLDITGNISGAGVLLVTGNAHFGGTPDWDGIIIVLGGKATIGGGGTSSTGFEGTMIVSDIYYGGDPAAPTTSGWVRGGTTASEMLEWDVSGGGGGNYLYYCNYVKSARKQLRDELVSELSETEVNNILDLNNPGDYTYDAKVNMLLMPEPDCDAGGEGTVGRSYIVEWYEVVED